MKLGYGISFLSSRRLQLPTTSGERSDDKTTTTKDGETVVARGWE